MGQQGAMLIYKILTADQWSALQAHGESAGAPVDLADGFVHFSTAAQVAETVSTYFAGQDGLMLLAIEAAALGDALKWEPSRGGQLFPHLYGSLRLGDVVSANPLPIGTDGHHRFPPGFAK